MTSPKTRLTLQLGFTLIEIMITLTIVGILVSVAIPNYREHISKSHRAEAQINLLQAASFMERFYSENNRYDRNSAGTMVALPTGTASLNTKWYRLAISLADLSQTTFKVTATPKFNSSQATDICGIYSITENGTRAATGSGTLNAPNCLGN